MTDVVSPAVRARMMASIHGRDTGPELQVRRYLHRAGLRFRLHGRGMPGRPDIVLPRYAAAVFVHGCFWHRHEGCAFTTTPATRAAFWQEKFRKNVARDRSQTELLRASGWRVFTIWSCEVQNFESLDRLFLSIVSGMGD